MCCFLRCLREFEKWSKVEKIGKNEEKLGKKLELKPANIHYYHGNLPLLVQDPTTFKNRVWDSVMLTSTKLSAIILQPCSVKRGFVESIDSYQLPNFAWAGMGETFHCLSNFQHVKFHSITALVIQSVALQNRFYGIRIK